MVTTQTADKVLKSYYLDAVAEQLDKSVNPFLAAIEKTTQDVSGKEIRKAVHYGVNGGVGAGTEDGDLPKANSNNYAVFTSTLKNLYGTIEISDKAIRASQNSEGAFVNLLNEEMEGLIKSSVFNFGRMLFGDGTGKVCTVQSISGTGYVVDTTANIVEGMCVDIYSASGVLASAGRHVTMVDRNNGVVYLTGNVLTTAGNYFVVQNSHKLEITGLGAIFGDSSTLYGLSRASNEWLSPVKHASVGEITENKILKAIDEVEEQSGSKINFIVCSAGVRRALFEAIGQKRVTETMELEGGFRALSFNGIPVVVDRFCPKGTMYLLNTDDFKLHQLCDWEWLQGEDGKVLKQIAGKPVFTATLVKYAELMCYRPCGQARLSGITEA